MRSVKRRGAAGISALLVLFLAVVVLQLMMSDRLQARQQAHASRIARALSANQAVLQHMTDAETGVRGFQLTGEKATDVADASGTLMLDVARRQWSSAVLQAVQIDRALLPGLFESPEI